MITIFCFSNISTPGAVARPAKRYLPLYKTQFDEESVWSPAVRSSFAAWPGEAPGPGTLEEAAMLEKRQRALRTTPSLECWKNYGVVVEQFFFNSGLGENLKALADNHNFL